MLVLDANVVVAACTAEDGFALFDGVDRLVAPPLLWPEVRSVLHVAFVRRIVGLDIARRALGELHGSTIRESSPRRLGQTAWDVAEELGWTKTYDAEYLALARLLRCPIATLDARVLRAAQRIGVDAWALPL